MTQASCTGKGPYIAFLSVNGSTPPLPTSPQGIGYDPRIAVGNISFSSGDGRADLHFYADMPDAAVPKDFTGLSVGSEASYNGYGIVVTSICPGQVQFDLKTAPTSEK